MRKPKPTVRELDLSAAIEQVEEAIDKQLDEPRRPSPTLEHRAAAAKASLKRWQTRADRALTYVTKYRNKVRYYEKKLGGAK